MKRQIVILDYSSNTVAFYENVEIRNPRQGEDISELVEKWLVKHTDHHLSNCSWMENDDSQTLLLNGELVDDLQEVSNEPYSRSIKWSVDDFKQQAIDDYGTEDGQEEDDWKLMFDESKFPDALDKMIESHDPNNGITWEDVSYYLNEFCTKEI